MNGSNEPLDEINVFHMGSKVARIVAAVRSMLRSTFAYVFSAIRAREYKGRPQSTLSPHPKTSMSPMFAHIRRSLTDIDSNLPIPKARGYEHSPNLLVSVVKRRIYVIRPLQLHCVAQSSQNMWSPARLDDR